MDENENAVESENADDAAHVEGFDEEVGESQRRSHKGHHAVAQQNQAFLEDGRRKRTLKEFRPQ